jgi:hypothetical protein
VLFDVDAGYQFPTNVMLAVGGDSVLDTFPDRQSCSRPCSESRRRLIRYDGLLMLSEQSW